MTGTEIACLVVALFGVGTAYLQHVISSRSHIQLQAQFEESSRGDRRLVEKLVNKVMAIKAPQEYQLMRHMSGMPETSGDDVPVPDHSVGGTPMVPANLAQRQIDKMRRQLQMANGSGLSGDDMFEDEDS